MKRMLSLRACATLSLSVGLVSVAAAQPPLRMAAEVAREPAIESDELESALTSIALERLSLEQNIAAESLTIVDTSRGEFPLQGRTVFIFAVQNSADQSVHTMLLDDKGAPVDREALNQAEAEAREARFGRFSPELAERLQSADAEELIAVIIRAEDEPVELERIDPGLALAGEEVGFLLEAHATANIEAAALATAPLLNDLMATGAAATADELLPYVYAELTPDELRALAKRPDVALIYEDGAFEPTLNVSRVVTGMALAHNAYGATGGGIRVGSVEVFDPFSGGAEVALANPFLAGTINGTPIAERCAVGSHATAVAGIIRSTHASHRGYAPNCALWAGSACASSWAQVHSRMTQAINWGALVINCSFGTSDCSRVTAEDQWFDDLSYRYLRSIVVAAGNCGGWTQRVGTPASGYNVIAVGNFDDWDTDPFNINNYPATWGDDAMSATSSWMDPPSFANDREKPELAAPGEFIVSTSRTAPWTANAGSGTSFAAPAVTGTIAAMHGQNVNLAGWPEAVKAILMATAMHNLEGAVRLSEFDGAGGLDAYKAVQAARRTRGGWWGYSFTCATPSPTDITSIPLAAGKRTRVAICWQVDPSYANYANDVSSDLNLQIVAPSGAVVASSTSLCNSYEIVDFTPAAAGTYRVRVVKPFCAKSPRAVGMGWYQTP